MITSDAENGGILTYADASIQRSSDSQLFSPIIKIEENGPVRVVISFDTFTGSGGSDVKYHGYKARIYFFSGSPFIKVEYTIKNSDHMTGINRPLYFSDFSLISKLAFEPNRVEYGIDRTSFGLDVPNTSYIYQSRHDSCSIRNLNNVNLFSGQKGDV